MVEEEVEEEVEEAEEDFIKKIVLLVIIVELKDISLENANVYIYIILLFF